MRGHIKSQWSKREKIKIDDNDLWVRQITCKERREWLELTKNTDEDESILIDKLVELCVELENGEPLFNKENPVDDAPSSFVISLSGYALRVNKLREVDIEDMVKNSKANPSD